MTHPVPRTTPEWDHPPTAPVVPGMARATPIGIQLLERNPVVRTHSVLVVDDERSVREMFTDVLAESGHRVALAQDGLDALAHLREGNVPCVVLTDVRMPRMDGFELASAVARDPQLSSVPVIVLTSDRILSFTSPARDKPFSPDELDALVQRSCQLHRDPGGTSPWREPDPA